MIGQQNLLKKLNSYTIDTFPRSLLLIGEKGIGKHTLVSYINENIIKFPLLDITENISDEYISAIYRNPNPYIYLIDLSKLTEKEQNVILKFIEEPLINSFIIILAESRTLILNTVLNRCISFDLEPYTKEELETFLPTKEKSDLLLSILRTPGKILCSKVSDIEAMYNLSENICNNLAKANYANALSIANKINLKDEYDKFDIEIFFDILSLSLFSHYLNENDINILHMYNLTRESRKTLLDTRINKTYFMNSYLSKLWNLAKRKQGGN